jgi:serine/threonine-protein kinase haspin
MKVPPKRTYGKKKTSATAAAAAVFGSASESSPLLPAQQPSARSSSKTQHSSLRDPLVDITSAVKNLSVANAANLPPTVHNYHFSRDSSRPVTPTHESIASFNDPQDLAHLNPLLQAYETDRGRPLKFKKWDEILEGELSAVKIAEASYAEVYRITTEYGSSIIKVMQLKLLSDPESMDAYTSVAVGQVVSEIRIMNAMTEVPGFVSFKDAHLVQGKPGIVISEAWDEYLLNIAGEDGDLPRPNSDFPHPASYSDRALFLAIELGDAGEVLQNFPIDTMDKFWDIFIGAILALSRAEIYSEFEVSVSSN